MTITDSIRAFPDLWTAYEGAHAIAGDIAFLSDLMSNASGVPEPLEGQMIYLARVLRNPRKHLRADAMSTRKLEVELACAREHTIRIGEYVSLSAATLAVAVAYNIQDCMLSFLSNDSAIRDILANQEGVFLDVPYTYDNAFAVAVTFGAIPDSF